MNVLVPVPIPIPAALDLPGRPRLKGTRRLSIQCSSGCFHRNLESQGFESNGMSFCWHTRLLSYLYLFLLSNCSHLSKEVTFLYPSFGTCSLKLKRVRAPYSTITNNSIVRPRSTLFFNSYSLYFLFMINTITQSYSSAHSRAADDENEERKGRVIVLARPALVNQSQQPNLST